MKTGPATAELISPETVISYVDNFVGLPAVATFAFPTTITHPGGLVTIAKYQYGLGAIDEFTDPNSQVTRYEYSDALDRLTRITQPIGKTIFEYEPATNTVRTKKRRVAGQHITGESVFDGLGRAWRISNPFRGAGASAWTQSVFGGMRTSIHAKAKQAAHLLHRISTWLKLFVQPAEQLGHKPEWGAMLRRIFQDFGKFPFDPAPEEKALVPVNCRI